MNSQWILNIFFFVQIHLKKSNFIFVARLRRNDRQDYFLSHVCGGFNFFFLPLHSRPFIYREVRGALWHTLMFLSYIKTYYKTPAKLKILTKHIEFPRLYSFSLLWILNNFQECACSPCPVNNLLMRKKRRFCWCVWNPRNITGFVLSIDAINELFFCFSSTAFCFEQWRRRLRCFFRNFSARFFEVSRGPFRNLFLVGRPTARCPEVGLDFWFLRCPEVELEIWFLMSRSWIGHLAARCPEVGLEFCVFTIFVFPTKFSRL